MIIWRCLRLLVPVALSSLGLSAQGLNPQVQGPPPPEIIMPDRGAVSFLSSYDNLTASVACSMLEREVYLSWNRDYSLVDPQFRPRSSTQVELLNYWPTDATRFAEDEIAIAGMTVKGKNVVAIWKFSLDEDLLDPTVDPVTQLTTYPSIHIPTVSRQRVYHSFPLPGHGEIRAIFKNLGREESLILQFQESRDLYDLDVATGSLQPLLSATQLPSLSAPWSDRWSTHHADLGHVYVFVRRAPTNELLALVDGDMDGNPDIGSTIILNSLNHDWGAHPLSDSSKYLFTP